LNNFITLNEFFTGNHSALDQAYKPMTIRFFILQAHYRSTLDFSTDALKAAEKGMRKLFEAYHLIDELKPANTSSLDIKAFENKCFEAMNDDLNTPMVIAHLFELAKSINLVNDGKESLTSNDIQQAKELLKLFLFDLLGLKDEKEEDNSELIDYLMGTMLKIRQEAKDKKDYATADMIRDELAKLKIQIKDTKEGAKWSFKG
jgi:cysteinyl-tRNA synthetase